MDFRLSPTARADGHRLHVHDVLGSTNSEALSLAQAGQRGPLWVVTHHQSEGRGRRGNAWVSPEGNLAASLLLPVNGVAPECVATLGFAAGLALVQALENVANLHAGSGDENVGGTNGSTDKTFRLKWPNDVLANGKKIAGILLEAEGRRSVAIGFGVNIAAVPEGLPYPATALAELGCTVDACAVFEALTTRFVETAEIWNKGRGFSRIRQLWLERAAGVGAPVSVRLPGGTLHGRHDGIDEGGRLMILAPDGTTHTVTAGEVHFGEAATAA